MRRGEGGVVDGPGAVASQICSRQDEPTTAPSLASHRHDDDGQHHHCD